MSYLPLFPDQTSRDGWLILFYVIGFTESVFEAGSRYWWYREPSEWIPWHVQLLRNSVGMHCTGSYRPDDTRHQHSGTSPNAAEGLTSKARKLAELAQRAKLRSRQRTPEY